MRHGSKGSPTPTPWTLRPLLIPFVLLITLAVADPGASAAPLRAWFDQVTHADGKSATPLVVVEVLRQDLSTLQINRSVRMRTPLRIGSTTYTHGLGSHANGHLRIRLGQPATRFHAEVGVDNNPETAGRGSVRLVVRGGGHDLAQTEILRGRQSAVALDASLKGLSSFDIIIDATPDGNSYDQADLANASVTLADGTTLLLDEVLKRNSVASLDSALLPFSFNYDKVSSDKLLPNWPRTVQNRSVPAGEERVIQWDDPKTGLRVRWTALLYKDYDAIEARLAFEHRGTGRAGLLSEVRPLRHHLLASSVSLVSARGGLGAADDFATSLTVLSREAGLVSLSAAGGRSSNRNLPFWLLLSPGGEGLYCGLGWSGQWLASFKVDADGTLEASGGMQYLNLRLRPGEKISQPSVLLGHFRGDRWAGHNALRRILYEQYAPLLDGHKPLPPVSWNHWFTFENRIDEATLLTQVNAVAPLGLEYFCIDAGWFKGSFPEVGDWQVNPARFPHGLEPLSQVINTRGMAMGLWFEPERVSQVAYKDFPKKNLLIPYRKYAAKDPEPRTWVLDLARPEACRWAVEMIGRYVRSLDLQWIRYDMNFDPLLTWQAAEANVPDRVGMKEILYIEGFYDVLDGLRKNHPKLLIEGSADSGRRIDLETLRRCHTFWISDLTGDGEKTRPHLTGGNLFLPGNYLNSNLIRIDAPFDHACQFGGALGYGHDFSKDTPERLGETTRAIAQYKELRHFLVEDYYPLFDYSLEADRWDGWQFHDPRKNEGFFLVFRAEASLLPATIVKLRGLNPAKQYALVTDSKIKLPARLTGKALRDAGLPLRLDAKRSALLVRYHVVP